MQKYIFRIKHILKIFIFRANWGIWLGQLLRRTKVLWIIILRSPISTWASSAKSSYRYRLFSSALVEITDKNQLFTVRLEYYLCWVAAEYKWNNKMVITSLDTVFLDREINDFINKHLFLIIFGYFELNALYKIR